MDDLERRIAQARGDMQADLVLRGGQVFDLITGTMIAGDVAICGGYIAGIGADYDGRRIIDVDGLVLVPGFIDTHLHVESSLITPHEFDRCVTPRGITTAICDPHEIANVIGLDGIRWFQTASEHLLMDLRVQLPSCVPSTGMETAGAHIGASDLRRTYRRDRRGLRRPAGDRRGRAGAGAGLHRHPSACRKQPDHAA